MSVTHRRLLKESLFYPKKLAAYRLLSIGKVMQYVFLLVLFLTSFAFLDFVRNGVSTVLQDDTVTTYAAELQWLMYPIGLVTLFIMNSVLLFAKISGYAAAGLLIGRLLKRRVQYRQVWRTAAFAITWSTLLTVVHTWYPFSTTFFTAFNVFITCFFLSQALNFYPRLHKKAATA